jgi:hypothetical protein
MRMIFPLVLPADHSVQYYIESPSPEAYNPAAHHIDLFLSHLMMSNSDSLAKTTMAKTMPFQHYFHPH